MNKKICEMVSERIAAQLDKGIIPWQKPWGVGGIESVSHMNGKPYSLINQFLLEEPGEYITFKQCAAEGGRIKKGSKAKPVIFFSPVVKEKEDENGEKIVDKYFILRYYSVFNVDDCEGIEKKFYKEPIKIEHNFVEEAETIIEGYEEANPELKIERYGLSDRAFYSPAFDVIKVPMKEQFEKLEEFYSTLFHEMVHSTGHESRLNRFTGKAANASFGSKEYSKEELVAEIGAATLVNMCGIETEDTFDNSVAYVQGWSKKLRSEPELIITATSKASKAVDFITGEAAEYEEALAA